MGDFLCQNPTKEVPQQMISEILHAAFSGELGPNQNIHSSTDPHAKAVSETERRYATFPALSRL